MIHLDIAKICQSKGIEKPTEYLVNRGFTTSTAYRLVTQPQERISYQMLEQLCLAFYCTPNELLSWQPNSNTTVDSNHPIQKLKPVKQDASIVGRLRKLSPEKLEEVQKFLEGLTNEATEK